MCKAVQNFLLGTFKRKISINPKKISFKCTKEKQLIINLQFKCRGLNFQQLKHNFYTLFTELPANH